MEDVNLDMVTLMDCVDMYFMKNECAVINDGKLLGFEEVGYEV